MAKLNFPPLNDADSDPINGFIWTDPNGQVWRFDSTIPAWKPLQPGESAVTFIGSIDLTTAPSSQYVSIEPGNQFVVSVGSTSVNGIFYPGLAGENVSAGTTIFYDGVEWHISLVSIPYTYPGGVERTVDNRLTDYVSVKDFGAVGDGVTDDTNAIQAAISALNNYGTINFPFGTYKITGTIDLGITGITVDANAAKFTSNFKGVMFDFNPDFDENNVEATSKSYMEWRGGTFKYTGDTSLGVTNVVALRIRGVRQATVTGCIFGDTSGVTIDKAVEINALGGHRFTNNRFLYCNVGFYVPSLTATGVSVPVSTSSFIDNNFILKESDGIHPAGKAFYVNGGWNRWNIQGGFVNGSGSDVFHFTNNEDSRSLTLLGIGFEQAKPGGSFLYLEDVQNVSSITTKPVVITGCNFNGDPALGGHTAIKLESTEDVIITGCRIEGTLANNNRTILATDNCKDIQCDESNSVPGFGFDIPDSIRRFCTLNYKIYDIQVAVPGFGETVDQNTGTQDLDMSSLIPSLFTRAVPKAYQVLVDMRDSSSSTTAPFVRVQEKGSLQIFNTVMLAGVPDDQRVGSTFYTKADANGDISVSIGPSANGNANVWVYILGVYY